VALHERLRGCDPSIVVALARAGRRRAR
jgi:hypothetical protein